MSSKLKIGFIIFILSISLLISLINAKDSYTISNDKIILSISSVNGIFHTASITQNNNIISTTQLCDKEKCPGSLKISINLTEIKPGKYEFNYYSWDNYESKQLNFTISNNQALATNNNNNLEAENNNPISKTLIVTTICRLSSIIKNNYDECKARFLG